MSRYRLVVLIVILLVVLVGCTTAKNKNQVLLILQENSADMEFMLKNEVGVMVDMLEKAGYDVVYASPSGEPIVAGDTTITPDLKLADVKVDDYAGFILPCMAVDVEQPRNPDAIRIIKEAAALGKPIAAQLGGILTLSDAGILEGKQFAIFNALASTISNGKYMGEGVVQDGNIITSGICPYMEQMGAGKDGTPELTQKLIDTLNSSK